MRREKVEQPEIMGNEKQNCNKPNTNAAQVRFCLLFPVKTSSLAASWRTDLRKNDLTREWIGHNHAAWAHGTPPPATRSGISARIAYVNECEGCLCRM